MTKLQEIESIETINQMERILEEIKQEYNSNHLSVTKVLNYEYKSGQFFLLASKVEVVHYNELQKLTDRKSEYDKLFNENYIEKLYQLTGEGR